MKLIIAVCLIFAVAVDSACLKNFLPSLIAAPVATNVAIPAPIAPVVGVKPLINLAAALGLIPAFGLEPVFGGYGCGSAIKFGAGLPIANVPVGIRF